MHEAVDNLILFGTQTGTAEDLAIELQESLEAIGVKARCENVFDIDTQDLQRYRRVYVFISTWGDGDPPDDAEDFCEWLGECPGGTLSHLEFAVFGLGDRGYEDFCGCGKYVDSKLEKAGAKRLLARVDCDIDVNDEFLDWQDRVKALHAEISV